MQDDIGWHPTARVLKYSPDQTRYARCHHARHHGPGPVYGEYLARLFPAGPEEGVVEHEGNSLTVAGQLNIARLIAGDPAGLPLSPTAAGSTARTLFGVGADGSPNPAGVLALSTLAPVLGEAPHTTWYQEMDPGFPQVVSPNTLSGQVTVLEGFAVFDWQEWGWAVCPANPVVSAGSYLGHLAPGAVLVNRKAAPFGPKLPDRSWVLQCTVRLVPVSAV